MNYEMWAIIVTLIVILGTGWVLWYWFSGPKTKLK